MPNSSFSTFAIGARQFVVQDALEMTECFAASYTESLTPMQIMASASPLGAEMITFLAPPSRWPAAFSRAVKRPVDSITTSTPWSPHGISAGSMTSSLTTSAPSTEKPLSFAFTSLPRVPPTESCFRRNAIVAASPIGSLTATSSTPADAPRASSARWNERPMRPKPLIPTRTVIPPTPFGIPLIARIDCLRSSDPR